MWIGYPQGEIPMRSVHGIAVSGPTFPATIWKLFMERAADYAPFPKVFPSPRSAPVWQTRTLQYAMTGGYYSPGSTSTTTTPATGTGADGYTQVPGNSQP